MGGVILLTGATGFLGSQVARRILRDTDRQIVVLVRGKNVEDARRRLARTWDDWPETSQAIGHRVQVVVGDLTMPHLGLDPRDYEELVRSVSLVIHTAAELQLDGSLEDLRRINVQGTGQLLELAGRIHSDHGLERFAHVSTAYVAGGRTGEVAEEDLSDAHGFSNAYEQTKYEGEKLVRGAAFPVSIFRPGMVVGDSTTGEIRAFNTVYVPLRLYLAGRLPLVPARREMPLNLVPVDYVARAVARLAFDPRAAGLTFHLTVSSRHLPAAGELIEAARRWAAEHLHIAPALPRFVSFKALEHLASAGRLAVPASLLSYFRENRTYRRDNVERLLGAYEPDWEAILPRLLEYAAAKGFLRRTGKTVHEQTLARLQSTRLPVRVHDIASDGKPRLRTGSEMSREIREAVGALRALGVEPGHRVALLGLNSSRFLSLDTAIGLSGAVSVPLYYTSPLREIEQIVRASGARLLLVGAPAVLDQAARLWDGVTIVSFCTTPVPHALAGRVRSWPSFLELGREQQQDASARSSSRIVIDAPVGPADVATLRFTSGTTGTPKGVAFQHRQVLWMAQTMAALLPWKVRIAPARYLSFLPMNHVVEGILGTYAPSFNPAPVDVYFLEDFHALAQALPRVRPTVFFSVPRFYEKVWQRFASGPAGRLYDAFPRGGVRAILRPLVRWALLRRAGLGSCVQLLAGSAPCPERLLRDFRELGIEIHNAYGLTEAPLISLNRYEANRLGTVGTPLPETEVRLAADGEVLVRGPQVACAFTEGSTGGFTASSSSSSVGSLGGSPEELLRDGWLPTGDLGSLTPEGSLIISGRRKEILITSYGKNVHPGRIEGMLRRIPGLAEAMVLGDNRPFLCALLWLDGGSATLESMLSIDSAVRHVNQELSHPEQVKRWAILAESPSIEAGELTGNLKIRRQNVLSRRDAIVKLLYHEKDEEPAELVSKSHGLLHTGESQCA